jgi:hypothetical protein
MGEAKRRRDSGEPPRSSVLAFAWAMYQEICVPHDASPQQIADLRLAFFAGAAVLFRGLMITLDDGSEPTVADMVKMEAIHNEIDAFCATFDETVWQRMGMKPN